MTSSLPLRPARSLTRFALVLMAVVGTACNNKAPTQVTPTVTITKPTSNQVITPTDDEDPNTAGIQFSVTATVTGLNSGSNAALLVNSTVLSGQTQQVTTTNGNGTVTFPKVTLAPGIQSLSVEVTDKISGAKAADSKTVNVESAAGCTFTSPGTTLTTTTTNVVVVCPNLVNGTPVSLTIKAPVALGGFTTTALTGTYSSANGAVFNAVTLENGTQTLNFVANPSGQNQQTATENVSVTAGGCGVWLNEESGSVYNARGETTSVGNGTIVASLDAGSPVELANLEAWVDIAVCPVGSTATLTFTGGDTTVSPVTATVAAGGVVNFNGVALPNGSPITETVTVTSASASGTSLPNLLYVDAIVPTLSIIQPTAGSQLGSASNVAVKIATTGVDSDGVKLTNNGATLSPAPAATGTTGEYDATVTLTNGADSLQASTVRKLGNTATSGLVGVDVGSSPVCINVISPTFTTCNHLNDANPATAVCDLTFEVALCSAVTHVTFGSTNSGLPGANTDGGLDVTVASGTASAVYALPQGAQTISATSFDAAGDTSVVDINILVGTIPPFLTIIYPDAGSTLDSQRQSVQVQWVGSVPNQVTGNISLFEGGPSIGHGTPVNSGTQGVATIPAQLPEGSINLTASTVDIYGNPATSAIDSVTVNTGPVCDVTLTNPSVVNPIFGLNGTTAPATDAGAGARYATLSGLSTLCMGQTLTVTKALPGGGSPQTLGTVTTDPNTGAFTFNALVSDGDVSLELILSLGSGNSLGTLVLNYDADFTAPVLLSSAPPFGTVTIVSSEDPNANTPGFVVTADPNSDGGAFTFAITYSGAGTFADAGAGSVTITDPAGDNFPSLTGVTDNGSHTFTGTVAVGLVTGDVVTVTATDEAGNTSTAFWTVTVNLSGIETSTSSTSSTSASSSSSGSSTGELSSTSSTASSSGSSSSSSSSSSGTITTTSTTSSGSSSSSGTLTVDSPSGTITLAQDQGGDRATFAGVQSTVSFGGTAPASTDLRLCTTVALGASPAHCGASGYFAVPGSGVAASGTFEAYGSLDYAEGPQSILAELVTGGTLTGGAIVGGSVVETSAAVQIDVETVPPVVNSVTVAGDPDGGPLNTINWPTGSSVEVDATVTGSVDGGTATLEDNGTALATGTVVDGSVAFTIPSGALADGTYTLTVLASDAVGDSNENASLAPPLTNPTDTISVVVARTAPDIIVSLPTQQPYTCSQSDNLIDGGNGGPCELTFQVSVGASVTEVVFSGAGTPTNGSVTPSNSSASTVYTLGQGAGQVLTATAYDQYGNSTTVTVTVTVDTSAPVITAVNSPTPGQTYITQIVSFDVNTTGAEAGQTVVVTSSATGAQIASGTVDASGHAVFSTSSAPQGSQTLTFTVANLAGNVSAPVTVNIDVNVPGCALSFSFPSGGQTTTFNNSEQSGGNVTVTGSTSTVSCFGGTVTFTKTTSGGVTSPLGTTTASLTGAFSFPVPFTNGESGSTITASMTNLNGPNSVSFVGSAQFTVPTLSVLGPIPNAVNQVYVVAQNGNTFIEAGTPGYVADLSSAPGGQIDAGYSVTEVGGAMVTISAGSSVLATQTFTGSTSATQWPPITVPEGYTGPLTFTATDTAGNQATSSLTIAEVDTLIPSAPSTVTFNLLNQYHSDFNVLFAVPATPDGANLTGEVGCTTSLILGTTTFNDAAFDNPAITTRVDRSSLGAAGSSSTASFTKMPPFNSNLCYARVVRPSGNRSLIAGTSPNELDVFWTKETIADSSGSSNAAFFGNVVAVGDINGDSKADIAVGASPTNSFAGEVTVLYGSASFPLTQVQHFSGASGEQYGQFVALGDINGDGRADLVVGADDKFDLFIAPSDGGQLASSPTVSLTGFAYPWAVAVAPDLSPDGGAGLILSDPGADNGGIVYVYYQRGDWTAATGPNNADVAIQNSNVNGFLGYSPGLGAIPDLNGDGYNELYVADTTSNVAYVISGKELFTLGSALVTGYSPQILAPPSSGAVSFGSSFAPIDMNFDGVTDMIVADSNINSEVFEFLGGSSGSFIAPTSTFVTGSNFYGATLVSSDINHDGHQDLMMATGPDTAGIVDFYYSGASAVETTPSGELSGGSDYGSAVVMGDVNGDGNLDIVVGEQGAGNGNVYVYH